MQCWSNARNQMLSRLENGLAHQLQVEWVQKVLFWINDLQSRLKPAGEKAPIPQLLFLVPGGHHKLLILSSGRGKASSLAAWGTELFVVLFSESPQCNSVPKLPYDYQKFRMHAICLLRVLHNISFRFQCWVLNYSSQTKVLLQDRCW